MPDRTHITAHPAHLGRRLQCRHIFTGGHRCGSPALRNENFCFYHHTSRGRAALPSADRAHGEPENTPFLLHPSELAERSGIQLAIAEVLSRLASNELDPRRAGLLLYGLQVASSTLPRTVPLTDPNPVEDITADPILGPLAPVAEFHDRPSDAPSKSLFTQLLEQLVHPVPAPSAEAPSAPASPAASTSAPPSDAAAPTTNVLPNLSASAVLLHPLRAVHTCRHISAPLCQSAPSLARPGNKPRHPGFPPPHPSPCCGLQSRSFRRNRTP